MVVVEVSSPVCYAGEADDAYMGFLDRDSLVVELNTLLEAERAGAQVAARLVSDAWRPELKVLARTIQRDQVPEDVVGAVVFLCTAAADFVTGQTMVIDGGQYFH